MLSKPKSRKANLDKGDMRHAVKCRATQRSSCQSCYLLLSQEQIRCPGGRTGLELGHLPEGGKTRRPNETAHEEERATICATRSRYSSSLLE